MFKVVALSFIEVTPDYDKIGFALGISFAEAKGKFFQLPAEIQTFETRESAEQFQTLLARAGVVATVRVDRVETERATPSPQIINTPPITPIVETPVYQQSQRPINNFAPEHRDYRKPKSKIWKIAGVLLLIVAAIAIIPQIVDGINNSREANASLPPFVEADYATSITYDQLARTPDDYKNKLVKVSGKVVQVLEEDNGATTFRVATSGDYDDIILLYCKKGIVNARILDGDKITFYGKSVGVHTYKSALGINITIPRVDVVKIDSPISQANPSTKETPAAKPTLTLEPTSVTPSDSIMYSGTGDDVVEIKSLPEMYVFFITGNSSKRHFSVKGYNSAGKSIGLFVNTTAAYSGVTIDPAQETTTLEISATGDWSIEIRSIYNQKTIKKGETYNGVGDDVFLIPDSGNTANISGNMGKRHFAVKSYGKESNELLVNTTDVYEGKVMLKGDPVILEVTAIGDWSITLN